jgi:subtilisin family serine protease
VWVERTEAPGIEFGTGCAQTGTLSIPGTARSVICVGAYFADAAGHVQLLPESSTGLTRDARGKPDLAAPGRSIEAAKAGTPAQSAARSGTSMAAPHVTGAIALILSHLAKRGAPLPNACQLRSALVHAAAGYTGGHHPALGFGRLDVAAALAALT